jgi:hypothetical protein
MRRLGEIGRVWNRLACKREASRRQIAALSPVLSCWGKAITLHSRVKMLGFGALALGKRSRQQSLTSKTRRVTTTVPGSYRWDCCVRGKEEPRADSSTLRLLGAVVTLPERGWGRRVPAGPRGPAGALIIGASMTRTCRDLALAQPDTDTLPALVFLAVVGRALE